VLIEGDRIRAIGTAADFETLATEIPVDDYPGATIMPGLVDAHTHLVGFGDGRPGDSLLDVPPELLLLNAARNVRSHLHAGVTTLRDLGTPGMIAFRLRDAARQGIVEAPRLILAGRPITITGGHLWYFGQESDGVDGVRRSVRQVVKDGADVVKIIVTGGSTRTSYPYRAAFTPAEVQAAVDEAHRFGKPTAAHCVSNIGMTMALDAGVETIVHAVFKEPDGTDHFDETIGSRLASSGAWIDYTVAQGAIRLRHLEESQAHGIALSGTERAEVDSLIAYRAVRGDHHARLRSMGARFVMGSDSSWMWYPMGRFCEEIIESVIWGLPVYDALRGGTSWAAQVLGIQNETGSLVPGLAADVLVVAGDPLRDPTALRNVQAVYQAGRRVVGAGTGPRLDPTEEAHR
jgi:imidazolonepropionase-like amidohydrolase